MEDPEPSICCLPSAQKKKLTFAIEQIKNKSHHDVNCDSGICYEQHAEHTNFTTNSTSSLSSPSSNPKNVITVAFIKALILVLAQFPLFASGYPVSTLLGRNESLSASDRETNTEDPMSSHDYWINMCVSIVLVLLGGAFAGLTLGLMGQDEIYLQVIQQSGEPSERKAATKALSLLRRGKHWVLVTLLRMCFNALFIFFFFNKTVSNIKTTIISFFFFFHFCPYCNPFLVSNVVTNETLPIVLDRVLGGGWPAVVSSTVAIVIFGEIIPQSISVRYGLSVIAWFAPFVLTLMYITYPVAYPIALLLDCILGKNHGTVYKRAGLKTLVGLHKTMGAERLNDDEVTIISAVLDLKDKSVASIMTPIEDVYTMSADRILDEKTIEEILHSGFSRIPVHAPREPTNFIGMLLVRTLITYDPDDKFPVSSFPLATLPETGLETSCLNILNYFQEGKSHMVVVSHRPGDSFGAAGVLTLEDVIEELIGEEIIDESDVYVDVHKAIRRTAPAPLFKAASRGLFRNSPRSSITIEEDGVRCKLNPLNKASNPKHTSNSNITIKRSNNLGNMEFLKTADSSQVSFLTDLKDSAHRIGKHKCAPSNLSNTINIDDSDDSDEKHLKDESLIHMNDQLIHASDDNYGSIYASEKGTLHRTVSQTFPFHYSSRLTSDSDSTRHHQNKNQDQSQYQDECQLQDLKKKSFEEYELQYTGSHKSYSFPGDPYQTIDRGDIAYQYQIQEVSPNNNNNDSYNSKKKYNDIGGDAEYYSYRNGGIIESIIKVGGVAKTIIEDVSDDGRGGRGTMYRTPSGTTSVTSSTVSTTRTTTAGSVNTAFEGNECHSYAPTNNNDHADDKGYNSNNESETPSLTNSWMTMKGHENMPLMSDSDSG